MKRICSVCKVEKDLEGFYKSNIEKLGREYRCKECTHLKYKRYREKKGDDWRLKSRLYHQKKREEDPDYAKNVYSKNKERALKIRKEYSERYPEKEKARALLYREIRSKRMIRPKECSECDENEKKIYAHHQDYSKPLDVIWVCAKCHGKKHEGKRR